MADKVEAGDFVRVMRRATPWGSKLEQFLPGGSYHHEYLVTPFMLAGGSVIIRGYGFPFACLDVVSKMMAAAGPHPVPLPQPHAPLPQPHAPVHQPYAPPVPEYVREYQEHERQEKALREASIRDRQELRRFLGQGG